MLNDYIEARGKLLDEAQAFIDAGDLENATAKRKEIEKLDADYEASATEAANIAALKGSKVISDKVAEIIGGTVTDTKPVKTESSYHDAFFKKIMGKEMSDDEKAVFINYSSGSASGGAVIPTETANEIISKMKEAAPLLNEITLLNIAGNVRYAVEGTDNDAALHTENASISASEDTLVTVTLGSYEIVKLVQVSDTVSTMSIPAFESWLVGMLVDGISTKLVAYIINGTGSSQPGGLESITWTANTNLINYTAGSLTAALVQSWVALLPGGYDAKAKVLMNKKTFFNQFAGLQDKAKNDLVQYDVATGKRYIYGYEIMLDSHVGVNEAYLGDFKDIVGNLSEAVTVKTAFDIDSNSNKYLGVGMFDSKVAVSEAFVKLAPTA